MVIILPCFGLPSRCCYTGYSSTKLRLVRLASVLILAAMLVSLVWDWVNIYVAGRELLPIIFNKGA